MCAILNPQKCADFGAHSDWSKFERERSDWSRAFHHQGRYGSIVSTVLIGREQSRDLICISRDLSTEAAILFCCHVVLR